MIVVARRSSEFGEIEIRLSSTDGSHAYVRGDWYHSHADRAGVSLASYVHAVYGLILQGNIERVLVLGCAGGTLAKRTMMAPMILFISQVLQNATAVSRTTAMHALRRGNLYATAETCLKICHLYG